MGTTTLFSCYNCGALYVRNPDAFDSECPTCEDGRLNYQDPTGL